MNSSSASCVEMDEEGNILLMAPGSIESSFRSGEVFGQLPLRPSVTELDKCERG